MTSEIRTSLKILETDAIVVVVRYSISKSCYKGIHHDFRSKKIRYSLFYMDSERGLSLELKKLDGSLMDLAIIVVLVYSGHLLRSILFMADCRRQCLRYRVLVFGLKGFDI
jgi:hypothetical protein